MKVEKDIQFYKSVVSVGKVDSQVFGSISQHLWYELGKWIAKHCVQFYKIRGES